MPNTKTQNNQLELLSVGRYASIISHFLIKLRKKMKENMLRKEYDRWQIEINCWNKGNTIYYIKCYCGNLAKRSLREEKEFECHSYGSKYIRMFGGNYVE